MTGRPIVVQWQDTADQLLLRAAAEPNPHLARRWQGLYLICTGHSVSATARKVKVSYRTVENWLEWYREGGCDAVMRHRRGQQRPHPSNPLTTQHIEALVIEARLNGFANQKDAMGWLDRQFGVVLTTREMSELFRSNGIYRYIALDAIDRMWRSSMAPVARPAAGGQSTRISGRWYANPNLTGTEIECS